MGKVEKDILQQVQRDRSMPLPPKIANAPQLGFGLEFHYSAFQKLTTCRQMGMGQGPIPWTAMSSFCRDYGISGDDQEDFEFLMEQMDEAFMSYQATKREAEQAKKAAAPRRMPPSKGRR